jgi:hypothetical protein
MQLDVLTTALVILQISVILFGGFRFFVQMSARLNRLEDQYKPNGGSSMRDAINRIELKVSNLEGKFEEHSHKN